MIKSKRLLPAIALVAACIVPFACCKKDADSKPSTSASGSATTAKTASSAPASSSASAATGDMASRKAQYCKRHDTLKGLMTPKCQSCLKAGGTGVCAAKGTPMKACEKTIPDARRKAGLTCMVNCGIQCACTLDCYEKHMPECIDIYLATFDCVEGSCEASCK